MSNSGPDDFEFLEKEKMSLEDYENTIYKKNTGWITDNTVYPYSKLGDFKDLTPEQIITRRLHLIHPNMVDDTTKSTNLTKSQRQAVIRLGMLKELPKKNQDKMRTTFINQMVKQEIKGTQGLSVEQLMQKTQVDVAKEFEEKVKKAEIDGDILARLSNLSQFNQLRGTKKISQKELEERFKELIKKGGSKRKTSKHKTSKRKTSKHKTSNRKASSSTKRKASSSIKHKSILKRKNKKGKKTTKKRMVSFYL
jgi:hypothetical protein